MRIKRTRLSVALQSIASMSGVVSMSNLTPNTLFPLSLSQWKRLCGICLLRFRALSFMKFRGC